MNTGVKWIGGLTLGVVALIASAMAVGSSLEAQDPADGWLTPEDVLVEGEAASVEDAAVLAHADDQYYGNDPLSAEEIAYLSQEVVQETPDYDPDNPFVIKRVLPIEGPIRYGEWYWDDEGVPDGPLVMTVDLQARVISVFRDGYEIGAAAALLGTPDHPTPTGVFPILTKERHNVSEKYNNAPMPWTLRLTWDGIAVHGGSTVELGYASHGCIGVPDEFASRLFDIAQLGDVVIITDGVMTGVGGSLDYREQ
ncbi:L,D-transpeptidase family protein [Aurantiacibacter sp. D1-12]|uniref:L,D-transpeptidase family protein n=1 Tax=Aurantiacibacter sp. D1-12 TaxID=2993658 RepID=UPI00237CE1A9|nr:L,D-transpeptidase family protein [Aurantiacibacter sp. D1-12]MDE1467123.1 L,D-transpeptidase family protein [Aurantiacibacter sp. D1-12]